MKLSIRGVNENLDSPCGLVIPIMATTEGHPYVLSSDFATVLDGVAYGSPSYAKLFNYETISQDLIWDCPVVIDLDGQLFCAAG
jgi:hypothetical protein